MSFLSGISGSYQKKLAAGLSMLPGDWRGKLSSWGLSAPIGSLGSIVFEVSSRKVRTFRDLKRTHKARFATHNLIGNKPMLEYIGPDVAEITFTMQLSASLGINPTAEADRVRNLCESGEAMYFVLCNQTVGQYPWVVEGVGESVDTIDNNGRVIMTQIDVTLKEYVPSSPAAGEVQGGV